MKVIEIYIKRKKSILHGNYVNISYKCENDFISHLIQSFLTQSAVR